MSTRTADVVIDRPHLQARSQRLVYSMLTLAAWVLWAYLWLPLITMIAWYAGAERFVREIILPDPRTTAITLGIYASVVAALGLGLVAWSRYNLRRFGRSDRRKRVAATGDARVREDLGLTPEELSRFRLEASIAVAHDEDGDVVGVGVGLPASPARPLQRT